MFIYVCVDIKYFVNVVFCAFMCALYRYMKACMQIPNSASDNIPTV